MVKEKFESIKNRLVSNGIKKSLITGINGQDGSYLAELLVNKGYEVWGTVKRNSVSETQSSRIEHLRKENKINLEYADLTDMGSLIRVLQKVQPDEIYNLASQSHVRVSFDQPIYTANATGLGTLNLLEAVRMVSPHSKLYQASSSEMFGNNIDSDGYQRESTPMDPVSPYGCAKVFSYNICKNYRNSYGMKIWNGILFNHESPRRGTNFVTNKVVKAAVRIKLGLQSKLRLGNLDATRDWGHAKDYVEAMWMMLQSDKPDDYVCSTGVSHSVKDLCEYTFSKLDLDYNKFIEVDEKHFRPEELKDLKGDYSKIRNTLGWKPKYTFESMIDEMINYWLEYYGV
jgi:GDPmannose 4,6-dehydratase